MHHKHPDQLRQMAYDHHRSAVEQARWQSTAPQPKARWRLPRFKVEWKASQPELVFRIKFAN